MATLRALVLVVGGGLFAWHQHLGRPEDRPPAVVLEPGDSTQLRRLLTEVGRVGPPLAVGVP
ncbi:hypothetical protein ACIBJD_36175 [Kitasatospora sp. NPDC050467]|uniref:hypothetical protein n=1 Tax=Kitasatospora sp. NPDC050467 TaxID=3364053 RepID=UPI0037B6BE96